MSNARSHMDWRLWCSPLLIGSVLVLLVSSVLSLMSYNRLLYLYTTDTERTTWLVAHGALVWKLRSAPNVGYDAPMTVGQFWFLDFGIVRRQYTQGRYLWSVNVPFWLPSLLGFAGMCLAVVRIGRARARSRDANTDGP